MSNRDANILIHTNYTNVDPDSTNVTVLVSLVFIRIFASIRIYPLP